MNASQRKSFLESLSTQNYEVFFSSLEKYVSFKKLKLF